MILHPDGYEHIEIFALVSVLNSLALRLPASSYGEWRRE